MKTEKDVCDSCPGILDCKLRGLEEAKFCGTRISLKVRRREEEHLLECSRRPVGTALNGAAEGELMKVATDALMEKPAATPSGEIRVTDPTTGASKGTKLARFDLIPAGPLWELAEHFGKGAQKYEERNYERGYKWSLSFAAMLRHAFQFWRGEDVDPETGSKHLIAVAWHALALCEFMQTHREKDDRVKP